MKPKHTALNIVWCVLISVACLVNLSVLFPLLREQIETGWGYPTDFEMLVLAFWLIQSVTVPLMIFGLVNVVYILATRGATRFFAVNTSLTALSILAFVLSVIFEFC